jgi:hypothetical protein
MSVMLKIKIQTPNTKAETKKNLGGKPGAVYAMVFKIGFCPGEKLDDSPVNQWALTHIF